MIGGADEGALPRCQVFQSSGFQHLLNRIFHRLPDFFLGARIGEHTVGGDGKAVEGGCVAVEFLHDVVEVYVGRGTGEQVSALWPPTAVDETAFVQGGHEAFEVGLGNTLPVGDGCRLHGTTSVAHG